MSDLPPPRVSSSGEWASRVIMSVAALLIIGMMGLFGREGIEELKKINSKLAALGETSARMDAVTTGLRRDVDKHEVRIERLEVRRDG